MESLDAQLIASSPYSAVSDVRVGDGNSLERQVMAQPRILIIENERDLVKSMVWFLEREGYQPFMAYDGLDGLRKAQTLLPDLILLDLNLPSLDGLEICRELKGNDRTNTIPIVMLTAKAEELDQLVGFNMGADDYVIKPHSNKVLMQRIKVLLRRVDGGSDPLQSIEHMGVRIDRIRHDVSFGQKKVDLTPTEFRLLECMLRQPGRAFSRHQLMDAAIGEGQIVLERTIDVHVKTLRRKLGNAGASLELIETVRGVGYRFREAKVEVEV